MVKRLIEDVKRFLRDEDGPTAVEYAFMATLILLVCIAAITAVGTKTHDLYMDSASKLP